MGTGFDGHDAISAMKNQGDRVEQGFAAIGVAMKKNSRAQQPGICGKYQVGEKVESFVTTDSIQFYPIIHV